VPAVQLCTLHPLYCRSSSGLNVPRFCRMTRSTETPQSIICSFEHARQVSPSQAASSIVKSVGLGCNSSMFPQTLGHRRNPHTSLKNTKSMQYMRNVDSCFGLDSLPYHFKRVVLRTTKAEYSHASLRCQADLGGVEKNMRKISKDYDKSMTSPWGYCLCAL
jgi:hypothetical protein